MYSYHYGLQGNFTAVAIWVAVAALFDFFGWDGCTYIESILCHWERTGLTCRCSQFRGGCPGISSVYSAAWPLPLSRLSGYRQLIYPISGIPYSCFSALRLARFNIDDRETTTFMGLPTPANGLFWVSYCCGLHVLTSEKEYLFLYYCRCNISDVSSNGLRNTDVSLKIKQIRLKGNERQLLLILLMIAFIAIWGYNWCCLWNSIIYCSFNCTFKQIFFASESEE